MSTQKQSRGIADGHQSQRTVGRGPANATSVSTDDIRLAAYKNWERAGKPAGDGIQFWLDAERELRRRAG